MRTDRESVARLAGSVGGVGKEGGAEAGAA